MSCGVAANFWNANPFGWNAGGPAEGNPRTEIIVRQRQLGSGNYQGGVPETREPHRSCLSDGDFGFEFRTGLRATQPCVCQPAEHVNCDWTSEV